MFTHAPPFWYRPAAAPPPAPAAVFMGFDDVIVSPGDPMAGQYTATKNTTFSGGGLLFDAAGFTDFPANPAQSSTVALFYPGSGADVVITHGVAFQTLSLYRFGGEVRLSFKNAANIVLYTQTLSQTVGANVYVFHTFNLAAYPGVVKLEIKLQQGDGYLIDNLSITPS